MDVKIKVTNYSGIVVFESIFEGVSSYKQAIDEFNHVAFLCAGDIIEIENVNI